MSTDLPVIYRGEERFLDGELEVGVAMALFESAGVRLRCDTDSHLVVEEVERG